MAKVCVPREQILKALTNTVPGKRELTLVQIREACGVVCPVVACQHWYGFMKKLHAEGSVTINAYEGNKAYMYALATKTKAQASKSTKKPATKKTGTKAVKVKANKSSKTPT